MRYKNIFSIYLITFLLPILLIIPLGLMNYIFLMNAGELSDVNMVVRKQIKNNGLYGSAIHDNHYTYKFSLYKKKKPDVIVVGSSRVLTFRENFFNLSFVNMGRAASFPLELEKFVDDLLVSGHHPKWILLGIDFWWGNPKMRYALNFNHHDLKGGELNSDAILAPTKWLIKNKFNFEFYYNVLTKDKSLFNTKGQAYGVSALRWGDGYSKDGSYYYTSIIYGQRETDAVSFRATAYKVDKGTSHFRHSDVHDEESIKVLKRIVKKLSSAGIDVVTFLSPLSPTVYANMRRSENNYMYIEHFRKELYGIASYHFDLHDPSKINTSDCEYIDGYHGGEVVSARIIKAMMSSTGAKFNSIVDDIVVNNLIKTYEGLAGGLNDGNFIKYNNREVDFLDLGCDKT